MERRTAFAPCGIVGNGRATPDTMLVAAVAFQRSEGRLDSDALVMELLPGVGEAEQVTQVRAAAFPFTVISGLV